MSFTVNNFVSNIVVGDTGSISISVPSGHTVGVVVVERNFSGLANGTVTDSAGNTYSLGVGASGAGAFLSMAFYSIAIASAITSVTYTTGTPSTNAFLIYVWDVTATGTIAFADAKGVINTSSTGTNATTTGSLTVTSADALILAAINDWSGGTFSTGTGFTTDTSSSPLAEHKAVTASTAATFTAAFAGDTYTCAGLAFQVAAAGAAPFKLPDLDERVTTKVIASDFIAPNLLADKLLKLPPFIQKEFPAQAPRARWSATDFNAPNLLADQVLKQPPFTQKELPGWTIRAKGNYTDFAPPNLLADQVLKLPPFIQAELPGVMLRGRGITDFIHPNLIDSTLLPTAAPLAPVDLSQQVKAKAPATDFAPPNLLTQQTLKLPPFTLAEFPGWSLRARALGTDFTAPNLLSLTLTTPNAPLLAIDLSQQVKSRWVGSDFNPGNLLLGILPIPPVAPIDATVSIRAKGVFTDFSPPNLALSTLIPPAALYPIETALLRLEYRWIRGDDIPLNLLPLRLQTVTPIAPQDLSGLRLDAPALRSDFAPPNLTLTLPVPPPPPASTGAGRHGTRRQARRRRELDVLRARIEAFKEQRADADRALMAAEDREVKARSQILKRIRVRTQELPKPIEQYAPVKKALAQRNVAADRYKSILGQIRAHQLEAERIQREIESEAADEEAALQLMHFLMMEIPWDE